jgi:hypothetical protein
VTVDEQDPKQIAQQSIDPSWPKVGECWRHYKGGLYDVLAIAVDEEHLTHHVVYRSREKGEHAPAAQAVWLRTPRNWLESVTLPDGREVPRFVRLGRMGTTAHFVHIRPCKHEWEGIQSVPGSGRRCRKCGLTECD